MQNAAENETLSVSYTGLRGKGGGAMLIRGIVGVWHRMRKDDMSIIWGARYPAR